MRYRKNRKSPVYETTVLIIFMTLITALSAVLFADVRKARAEDQASGVLPASVLFEGEDSSASGFPEEGIPDASGLPRQDSPAASDPLCSGEGAEPASEEIPAADMFASQNEVLYSDELLCTACDRAGSMSLTLSASDDDPENPVPAIPETGSVSYGDSEADAFLLAMPVGTDPYAEEYPEAEGVSQPYEQSPADTGKADPDDPEADPPSPIPMPDFRVTKTCETDHARPGDTVRYTITIENTGNVVLHSVVSTEKFLGAGVQAYFEAGENVLLNAQRTQALISEIAPGQTSSLSACVVIPQNAQAQELVNMVEVTSQETGARVIQSESRIPLVTPVPARNMQSTGQSGSSDAGQVLPSAAQTHSVNPVPGAVSTDPAAVRIIPQTMDPSPVLLFLSLCVFSVVTVLTILVSLHKDERKRRI